MAWKTTIESLEGENESQYLALDAVFHGKDAIMATAAEVLVPIRHLRAGQVARVADVLGQAEEVHRLNELGFRAGCLVEMLKPGAPCIIRLAGQRFCFRADDLTRVLVRTEDVA